MDTSADASARPASAVSDPAPTRALPTSSSGSGSGPAGAEPGEPLAHAGRNGPVGRGTDRPGWAKGGPGRLVWRRRDARRFGCGRLLGSGGRGRRARPWTERWVRQRLRQWQRQRARRHRARPAAAPTLARHAYRRSPDRRGRGGLPAARNDDVHPRPGAAATVGGDLGHGRAGRNADGTVPGLYADPPRHDDTDGRPDRWAERHDLARHRQRRWRRRCRDGCPLAHLHAAAGHGAGRRGRPGLPHPAAESDRLLARTSRPAATGALSGPRRGRLTDDWQLTGRDRSQ